MSTCSPRDNKIDGIIMSLVKYIFFNRYASVIFFARLAAVS